MRDPAAISDSSRSAARRWGRFYRGERAVLVWDELSAHWSRAMRAWVAEHDWLTQERLPAYAPELNPVELLWYSLKKRDVSSRADLVAELIPAASPRSPTAASRPSTLPRCAPWSARPSAASAPPRHRLPPIRRPTRPSPRAVVDDLAASTHAIAQLILEVAPVYLSDTVAAGVLALLCDQVDEPLRHGFSARADETPADQPRRAARCARPSFWARGL
ncbi:transposase [Streptomyces flaveolus]|uniref:transposase n=1 Tax=Streptomyces flaveolus TaxID=67297 RepID=UPI0036FB669F